MAKNELVGALTQYGWQRVKNLQGAIAGVAGGGMFHPGGDRLADLVAGDGVGQHLTKLIVQRNGEVARAGVAGIG